MKATLPLAALLLATSIPAAQAQTESTAAEHKNSCPDCSAKEQKILKLKAEIAALKADTPGAADNISEPVPITPVQEEANTTPETSGKTYTVQAGDGLMKIARKTGCKASEIAAVNNIELDAVIRVGQVLKLPAGASSSSSAAAEEAPKPKTYTIKDGDTYYSISRRLKIPLDKLMAANPKAPANRLYTGRVIKLPVEGSVPAPTQETTQETNQETTAETTKDTEISEIAPKLPPSEPPPLDKPKILAVSVEQEISYGDFAKKHGTTTERLNSLNDLNLTSATILAKGSELYVPSTPEGVSN